MNRADHLGEEAQALIEATLDAYEPTASNRAQVRWGVDRRLSSRPVVGVSLRHRRVLVALAAAAIVLVGVGVAGAFAWRVTAGDSERAEPVPARKVARMRSAQAGLKPTLRDGETEPSSPEPPAPVASAPRRVSRATSPSGDLAAETALIARAQAATNRGEGEEALRLLEQYDRRFSQGALAEERAAAHVFALCSSGQRGMARDEAARFLARWPRSPQAARVRSACREALAP